MINDRWSNPPVYIDKIFQVFEANANLHIIGGCGSGNIGLDGVDLHEKCLHLVLPVDVAMQTLPEIVRSLPKMDGKNVPLPTSSPIDINAKTEFAGSPMIFDISDSI